jgi:hypothetical protein
MAAAGVVVIVLATVAPAAAAQQRHNPGQPRQQGKKGKKAAVVSPTLDMMAAGSEIGLPLACLTAIGTLGAASNQLGPVLSPMAAACTQLAAQGAQGFRQLNGRLAPLAVANPVLNPVLEAMAKAAASLAEQHGREIAPLGPVVATGAADIRFFEGS